jgi:hypothetical protein
MADNTNRFIDAVPMDTGQSNAFVIRNVDLVIKEMYENGLSAKAVADALNKKYNTTVHTRDSVRWSLTKTKAKLHRKGELNRLHSVNDHYFSEISTEEQAYILGWIWTDGNIFIRRSKNANSDFILQIYLHEIDVAVLELIKKALNVTYPIGEYKDEWPSKAGYSTMKYLKIFSKPLVEDLIKLGCTPNKSFTIQPPSLSKELMQHFWRGAIDGDGHISSELTSTGYLSKAILQFYGTIAMVAGFRNFIGEKTGKYGRIKLSGSNGSCEVRYTDIETVRDALTYLYSDPKYFLLRKKNNANILLNSPIRTPHGSKPDTYLTNEEAKIEEQLLIKTKMSETILEEKK